MFPAQATRTSSGRFSIHGKVRSDGLWKLRDNIGALIIRIGLLSQDSFGRCQGPIVGFYNIGALIILNRVLGPIIL